MIDVFEETKSRLTMQDVVQHYGFAPTRSGFIKCPFHTGDRTASLKVYPGGRGFHCFGCNRGGSVVDFTVELFGLSPLDAVRQLDRDFNLHLPLDRQQSPQERREAEKAAQRRRELADTAKEFEMWRGTLLDKLTACFRLGHLTMRAMETPADFDRLTEAEALAVREQAYIEYLSDLLLSGSMENMMPIFRERGKIGRLCEKILNNLPMKSRAA